MKKVFYIFVLIFSIILLVLLSRISYLIFHTIVELLSVSLGISLLFFAMTKINLNEISKFEVLSLSYAFVAIIDLLHTLAYKGMGVFKSITANDPTQLWIAARILESMTIFHYMIISRFKNKKYNYEKAFKIVFHFLLIYFITITLSIFIFNVFPDCFIEGIGLTWFKKITEYTIILILLISLILSKADLDNSFYYYRLAIILTILSEFTFTLYKDVYGIFALIGHILKYLSFIFIYRYVLINIIEVPYSEIKILGNELKTEKRELILAKNEAEKANKAKSAFIANINHEINTPLNVISGYAFVLYNEEEEIDKKELIQNILNETQSLSKIFDNLLTISQIEIGEFKIQWSTQNLKSLIQTIVELYAVEANEKQLYYKIELDETLDKVMKVPENVLWKIIANLLSNAIKFTKEGFVSFSARLQENLLYMNIKDSGNGIDLMSYTDLLDSFNIGEYYLNKTHDGVGLGLSIVNKLVKILNGHIDVKSKIGEGSEFSIVLDIDESKYTN